MPHAETILGLAFATTRVQAVLLRHDGPTPTLLALDEWTNTIPFGTREHESGVRTFTDHLKSFITKAGVQPDSASAALGSEQTFILTLPFEEGISRLERNDHVRWEIGQYFPDANPGDFVTDVQPITNNKIDKWVKSISVSIRKQDADLIKEVIGELGLGLKVIDVDHFSADTALRYNYPDIAKKYMALVGIKENRVDVSILRNGVLESYSYHAVTSNQEISTCISSLPEYHRGLYSLSAYGPFLDTDLLGRIRRESSLLVEALNPLRHIDVADSLRLEETVSLPSYRFATAVGVALRRD
ncbi:MAG: hypothetical protein OEV30_11405 [Ignavibacteria bacterium]|nr:hypothetical protein [Ignavibacteria bacterium]